MNYKQSEYLFNGRTYLVSSDGMVTRLPTKFRKTFKVLSPYKTTSGYLRLFLNNKSKFVHQMVYEAFNGPIPAGMDIDHINGVRDDNRLSNLRTASRKQNALNRKAANSNSKSGVRGVYFHKSSQRWVFAVSGVQKRSSKSFDEVVSYAKQFHGETA